MTAGRRPLLGTALRRVEDDAVLRGSARYVDDVDEPDQLHVVLVRSTLAHGRLRGVDPSSARAAPGVVDVVTAADLELPPTGGAGLIPRAMARPVLAREKVRFVGDVVAAVVAETRAAAADAAELVVVDVDPLPAAVDPEAAAGPGAPLLFEAHGTNVAVEHVWDPVPDALDGSDVVVSERLVNARVAPVPLEPNGVAARPDPSTGGVTAWISTQSPHTVRDGLAAALGLERDQVRVVARTVGGGFGTKLPMYPEHVLVCALALRLGRPVKWVESRSESMLGLNHGRAQVQHVQLGARRDGTLVGLRGHVVADAGAYPGSVQGLPVGTRRMSPGAYRIRAVDLRATGVATNTTPIGAYRGAGRPEAAALVERMVDLAAAELGIDPVDLRRRNLVPADAMPYTTATGAEYDSGDYRRVLDEAVRIAGYDDLRAEQARRRAAGDHRLLGIGVSLYVEYTASGEQGCEYGRVEVGPDGRVHALVGTASTGQGHDTTFSALLADRFRIPMAHVDVVQGDTGLVPRGDGTKASRVLQIGGSVLHLAAAQVVDKARRLAAHVLEASPDDVVVGDDGRVGVAGVPARSLGWAELAAVAADPGRLPEGMAPGLAAELDFDQGGASFPYGAHVAVVEVDADTGHVTLVRYVAVDDCGRVQNPPLVRGQQHGGVAQGAAQALWEEVVFDADGNPLTASLLDYAIPTAVELPRIETASVEVPTPLNPLGAKGIGESGATGSTPAVQNAVVDALAHLGVRHVDMPCTPERVWRAIRSARAAEA